MNEDQLDYPSPISKKYVIPVVERMGTENMDPEQVYQAVEKIHQLSVPMAGEVVETVLPTEGTADQVHIGNTWVCIASREPDSPAIHVNELIDEHDLPAGASLVNWVWNEFASTKLDMYLEVTNALVLPKTPAVQDRLSENELIKK